MLERLRLALARIWVNTKAMAEGKPEIVTGAQEVSRDRQGISVEVSLSLIRFGSINWRVNKKGLEDVSQALLAVSSS